MTEIQKEQITTLRLQGMGYMKIGKMLGISNDTVRSFCRRNGLSGETMSFETFNVWNVADKALCPTLLKYIAEAGRLFAARAQA